jgi:hypothetical protein
VPHVTNVTSAVAASSLPHCGLACDRPDKDFNELCSSYAQKGIRVFIWSVGYFSQL